MDKLFNPEVYAEIERVRQLDNQIRELYDAKSKLVAEISKKYGVECYKIEGVVQSERITTLQVE